ncbi:MULTISPECIES: EAL domain-containing protein [unclassified Pseudofrankia]|uniref:sensor domain-containing phosphodiesterase n=1 Tax=unclassified Pseudofrankia TaxID=2994372 RepID=UPI0008DA3F47|nr:MULTISPECIES: EAL domain-containing protein [unclassified Pseudofrankia]MDT3445712.1 EAL domain-containing protein [Pseudofrankia sp. BMG5.37]OHV42480.1 diguanylate phosphodiesterase [Pseudofrankia sp. BMG5.36]
MATTNDATFGPAGEVLEPDQKVTELLDVLRHHLAMDVAVLSMWDGDLLVTQVVSGDGDSFGLAPGVTIRRGKDLGRKMEAGEVPTVVGDTHEDARMADSPLLRRLRARAYVTTCLTDTTGAPYGLLMALAHHPRPALQDRESRFLSEVADFIRDSLIDLRRIWEERSRVWHAICDLVDNEGPGIVYQPIRRMTTNAVVGIEALSRFPARCCDRIRDPQGWFADAALVGLGAELELASIQRAITVLPHLPAGVKLAVNASPKTVTAGLVAIACDLPERDRLVVEVTEHENYTGCAEVMRAVDCLRDHGIHIAVDDAGAGYSDLEQLLRLRPDVVKLDCVITRGIDQDPARRAVAAGIVRLAEEIDGKVIAEGIETTAERDSAIGVGVHYGQGYLLGKPTPELAVACSVSPGVGEGGRA